MEELVACSFDGGADIWELGSSRGGTAVVGDYCMCTHMYSTVLTVQYYTLHYKVHDACLLLWLRVRWHRYLIFLGVVL